jgi:serine phosphatase RsbU (regulator of sigma subunit)
MSLTLALGAAVVVGLAAGYLALAGYVWRLRAVSGARPLIVMILAVVVWTVFYGLELASTDERWAIVWSGLKFVGIVALPPAWLTFVLQYTGRRGPLPRRLLALLLVEPAVVLTVLAIPPIDQWFHHYDKHPDRIFGAPIVSSGPLFWPHAIYVYLMMSYAVYVLSSRLIRVARPYRRAAAAIIAASALPLLGNLLYNLGLWRIPVPDPTPLLLGVTGIVLVWGFLRLQLFDVTSVARDAVVEQMADGLLVLDPYGRVVDANPAGSHLLGIAVADLVGRRLGELVPAAKHLIDGPSGGGEGRVRMTGDEPWQAQLDLSVRVNDVLDDAGRRTARVVVLRDITDRIRDEHRLRELLDQQTELNTTLQQGLRPASLPVVPGLQLAARSIPAARGGQLSGDFYDVHQAGEQRWAFVLGDVSGKGVHAAVVTSLARYTVRTLSAQPWPPRDVLGQLNHALRAGTEDPERFCTVAYGQVTPRAGGGMRLVLALGGHPQPLLRRADGSVTPVGRVGTVLGLLPQVEIHEAVVELDPGDTLVVYTDGVTEARLGDELFGDQRLADALAAADGGADQVADAVLAAVQGFTVDRDDVALLVMTAT